MASTNFQNYNWSLADLTSTQLVSNNEYTKIRSTVTIWSNPYYSTYVTFLNGSEAENLVDDDDSQLSQATLNGFKQQIGGYDGYSLRLTSQFDEFWSVSNQRQGTCLYYFSNGISCMIGSTESSSDTVSETRTYWLPTSLYDTFKDTSDPVNIWDSSYDQYKIDDVYVGLTQYQIAQTSSSSLTGNKF